MDVELYFCEQILWGNAPDNSYKKLFLLLYVVFPSACSGSNCYSSMSVCGNYKVFMKRYIIYK